MLVILIPATKGYLYAMNALAPRLAANLRSEEPGHFVFTTDKSKEAVKVFDMMRGKLPEGWKMTLLDILPDEDDAKSYNEDAQLRIAKLQGVGFDFARHVGATDLWSLESDMLPPPNALKLMRQALAWDDGFYDVAGLTYNNGQFLGGRGTSRNWIAEDFTEEERKVSRWRKKVRDGSMAILSKGPNEKEQKRMERISKSLRNRPPLDSVWGLNAKKGWRKRGWMDSAYPAIGRGAMLPTDWIGLGCTLLSKRALELAYFDGYEGKGTQDLWLCWRCWKPEGLNMAIIPHSLCHHVKKDSTSPTGHKVLFARHELEGEHEGHLRCDSVPFFDHH